MQEVKIRKKESKKFPPPLPLSLNQASKKEKEREEKKGRGEKGSIIYLNYNPFLIFHFFIFGD